MSKVINYLVLFSGITLLFYFSGILSGTGTTALLDMALNPNNLENTALFTKIIAITGAVLAVVSTFVARSQNSDFYLFIPMVITLFGFGWDFLSVYNSIASTSVIGGVVAILVFSPMMIGYIIAIVEWWRGTST